MAWVPHPEASLASEDLPDGWLPCNGSTITNGPWIGGKTPDLNSIGAFLRGGTDDKVLEVEQDQVQDHEHTSTSASVTVQTSCSTSSHSSDIGGVDSAARSGTETRPINMKVSYVMRCW